MDVQMSMLHAAKRDVVSQVGINLRDKRTVDEKVAELRSLGLVSSDAIFAGIKDCDPADLARALANEVAKQELRRKGRRRCGCFFSKRT
tara:strand:- start:12897 stop:13163 length:267 start_codon:yes stop_codon:yes gene_type:complete